MQTRYTIRDLHEAIKKQNFTEIASLLSLIDAIYLQDDYFEIINGVNKYGMTALHHTCHALNSADKNRSQQTNVMKVIAKLLHCDADPNLIDNNNRTPYQSLSRKALEIIHFENTPEKKIILSWFEPTSPTSKDDSDDDTRITIPIGDEDYEEIAPPTAKQTRKAKSTLNSMANDRKKLHMLRLKAEEIKNKGPKISLAGAISTEALGLATPLAATLIRIIYFLRPEMLPYVSPALNPFEQPTPELTNEDHLKTISLLMLITLFVGVGLGIFLYFMRRSLIHATDIAGLTSTASALGDLEQLQAVPPNKEREPTTTDKIIQDLSAIRDTTNELNAMLELEYEQPQYTPKMNPDADADPAQSFKLETLNAEDENADENDSLIVDTMLPPEQPIKLNGDPMPALGSLVKSAQRLQENLNLANNPITFYTMPSKPAPDESSMSDADDSLLIKFSNV